MSLILEALRKSEAQRQLGRVPGVLAPMPPARRRRAPGRWAGLLVLLLLGVGWLTWQSRAWTARPAPVHAPQPPPAQPALGSAATLPERRIDIAPGRDPGPPAQPGSAARPAVAAHTDEPAASAPFTTPAPTAQMVVVPVAAPTAAALPSIADLLPGERAALPPLRISMHVYAQDPAARFVIIDGKRVTEGALLADGVVLSAIDREGIVIDAGGRALRVFRP